MPSHAVPSYLIPSNLRINPPKPAPSHPLQSPSILLNPTLSLLLILLLLRLPSSPLPNPSSIKAQTCNLTYTQSPLLNPTLTLPYSHPKKKDTINPSVSVSIPFLPLHLEIVTRTQSINHTSPHLTFSFLRKPDLVPPHLMSSTNHNHNHNHNHYNHDR